MGRVFVILIGIGVASTFNTFAQPEINQHPEGKTALVGARVSLAVEAVGSTPLQFQWRHNGQDIPNANGRILRFTATPSRAGSYSVLVRDAAGERLSSAAKVGVVPRPAFVVQPKNTIVGEHQTAVFTTVLNDSGPYLRMIWHNNNRIEGPHEIPPSTGLDTDDPELVMPDCINDAFWNSTYWLAVTNEAAGITSKKVRLTVVGPPRFSGQPRDRAVPAGKSVVFSARVARDPGPDQPTLQWFKDGDAIPGATTSRLTIANVQPGDEGNYFCVATGIGGTTASWGAQLTVKSSEPK